MSGAIGRDRAARTTRGPWARIPQAAAALATLLASGCAPLTFDDLDGWAVADHAGVLAALERHCRTRPGTSCAALRRPDAPRAALEAGFRPVAVEGEALFTGYFEPELAAAPSFAPGYPVPLYAPPVAAAPLPTRAEIEAGALAGRGLEIAWLADPVEAFFLHVQGSGRLRFPDGRIMRVGYAGKNGYPYRSIGRLLAERTGTPPAEITAQTLAAWLRADPDRGRALMAENSSFIFFRRVDGLPDDAGPIGAAGLPLSAGVSAAADPAHHPAGSLLWIEGENPPGPGTEGGPVRRLVLVQDTGSAIKGPARLDLFLGSGTEAGARAGALRARGRVIRLVPRDLPAG
ncbi:MAG: MltA domain-containing protein [Paracoccaceae bacterium]